MKKYATSILVCLLCGWSAAQAAVPVYHFVVKNTYPHDTKAYTEGLFFKDGVMYESTGMKGQSSVRKVDLASGKVLQQKDLPAELFGEGIAELDGNIVALTWTTGLGFVFDMKSFALKKRFNYPGEGWALTTDKHQLYMSDGTAFIRVLDANLKEVRRFEVKAEGTPINRLNEIEWVEGEIYANVWGTEVIARIDPASGNVVGWIDLTNLMPPAQRGTDNIDAVLNGIAYDSKKRRLFVTGKLWPKLFEIELVKVAPR
ncbi:MAG: glutaminyl-peptide cyclotransferase [Pseudomonadota bacterium]